MPERNCTKFVVDAVRRVNYVVGVDVATIPYTKAICNVY